MFQTYSSAVFDSFDFLLDIEQKRARGAEKRLYVSHYWFWSGAYAVKGNRL